MAKLTEAQKTALIGLLDWYFASIEVDTGAKTGARRTVKDSQSPKEYQVDDLTGQVDDLTGDSDAPPTAEEHAQRMKQMAHVDASATGQVPDGFVPTSAMNGRPSSGMKTDSAMVKRI